LQLALLSEGHLQGEPDGVFGPLTHDSVRYFQMTHLGEDGRPLEVDGVVGPKTWWAVLHASGAPQRSGLDGDLPSGNSELRNRVLGVAKFEHAEGVCEVPDGSNRGDGVTKYLPQGSPAPWCCFFVSWCWHEATSEWPLGERHGHVLTLWRAATRLKRAFPKAGYRPRPGDFFVMLYRRHRKLTGSGHIGLVYKVAADGVSFNTLEGNCGNRVKLGTRRIMDSTVVGFINLYKDEGKRDAAMPGLIVAADVSGEGTR